MQVGAIGAGTVGSACLMSLVLRGRTREIVVLNRTCKRAKAEAPTSNIVLPSLL